MICTYIYIYIVYSYIVIVVYVLIYIWMVAMRGGRTGMVGPGMYREFAKTATIFIIMINIRSTTHDS